MERGTAMAIEECSWQHNGVGLSATSECDVRRLSVLLYENSFLSFRIAKSKTSVAAVIAAVV